MLVTVSFGKANSGHDESGTGKLGYTLLNPNKSVFQTRTTSGVSELHPNSGNYGVNLAYNIIMGKSILWDIEGEDKAASETLPFSIVNGYTEGHSPSDYIIPPSAESIAATLLDQSLNNHTVLGSVGGNLNLINQIHLDVEDLSTLVIEGAPVNITAASGYLVSGNVTQTGGYQNTLLDNDDYWVISNTGTGGLFAVETKFMCGNKVAAQLFINGRFDGKAAEYANVYAWNYLTSTYDLLSSSTTRMNDSSVDLNYSYALLPAHQRGFEVENGEVRIKIETNSTPDPTAVLRLDQMLIKATATSSSPAEIAEYVWRHDLTTSKEIINSASKQLSSVASNYIYKGKAADSTINTVTLEADASSQNGAYDPATIFIAEGKGAGQARNILEYIGGATRKAYVDRNWKELPDSTSTIIILADAGREHINEGVVRTTDLPGGFDTYNQVKLNAASSTYNNAYTGQRIFIRSGTGEDQVRRIASYDGGTRVATLTRPWAEPPASDSVYVILPQGALTDDCINTAVWSISGEAGRSLTDKAGFSLISEYDLVKTAAQVSDIIAYTSGLATSGQSVNIIDQIIALPTSGTVISGVWNYINRALTVTSGFTLNDSYNAAMSAASQDSIDAISGQINSINNNITSGVMIKGYNEGQAPSSYVSGYSTYEQVQGVQNTVDGISNVTRISTTLPKFIDLQASPRTMLIEFAYKNLFGQMDDPDNDKILISLYGMDRFNISYNQFLFKDFDALIPLELDENSGLPKLAKEKTGLYYFYLLIDSNQIEPDQISLKLMWEEDSTVQFELKSTQFVDFNGELGQIYSELTRLTSAESSGEIWSIKQRTDLIPDAPAMIGSDMNLTNESYSLISGYIKDLEVYGDNSWKTATGFTIPSDLDSLATSENINNLQIHGDLNWGPPQDYATIESVINLATSSQLYETQLHGDLYWTTASGFATPEDVQVVVPEPVFSGSVEFNGVIDNQITINPTELNSSEISLIANAVRAELAPELANLDASISSRMSSGDIQTILNALPVAPDNAAITLIRKILTNKTQDLGDQFIVFEDDEVTPLGAFSWNSYTGERGELKPVGGD